jgi:hypothetical protein
MRLKFLFLLLPLSLIGYMWFYNLHIFGVRNGSLEVDGWSSSAPLNESLGFGKIYYISLPSYGCRNLVLIFRRADRQDHMSLAFYASGLRAAEVPKS